MSEAEVQETPSEQESRAPAEPVTRQEVMTPAVGEPMVGERTEVRRVEQSTVWSPSQIVLVAAGALFMAFGLVAMIKGGLGGDLNRPFVQVFSYAQTPALGLIELGAGIVLLLAGLVPGVRAVGMLLGALVAVAGGLVLGNLDWVNRNLTTDNSFGWVPLVAGAVVVVVLGVVPSIRSNKVIYRS